MSALEHSFAGALQAALADLPLGGLRGLESVDSTNAEAARWVEQGAPHLALVVAEAQTAGRGRLGRHWHTTPGASLAFSVILRPEQGQPVLASLTALGALSVCNVLRQSYALPAQIKWPNDVLVARRKVAGVLAEAVWAGNACAAVILGVGLNVAPASIAEESLPASAVSFPVTCVENELGKPLSRFEVLRLVLQELLNWLPRLPSSTFLQAWERALAFKGEPVQVITPGIRLAGQQSPASKIYEGELLGLAGDGSLRLKLSSGEVVSLISGDLHLRPRL